MELDNYTARDLRDWLTSREQDIAYSIEDFGDLSSVFEAVIGRPANVSPPQNRSSTEGSK